ncbi:MAG: hypothetical protein IJB34_08400 [Clostridia bacterium]|nr:hypothetical protein [Clostridia bacterium]MBQ3221960.1 hypothetical protein [Clostridia bacterium]
MGQGTKFLARFGREAQDPLSSAPLGESSPQVKQSKIAPTRSVIPSGKDEIMKFGYAE